MSKKTPFPIQYFCKTKYPPNDGFNGEVFSQLCKDICGAAIYSGFEVFKNGKYPAKYLKLFDCQRFSCCKCRTFVSQRSGRDTPSVFRKTSYNQDKLNTRGSNFLKKCHEDAIPKELNSTNTSADISFCSVMILMVSLLFLGLVKPITIFTPSLDIQKFNCHQGCWAE